MLTDETPSVSRMREIRTSGLMRGEGLNKTAPPLLDCETLARKDSAPAPVASRKGAKAQSFELIFFAPLRETILCIAQPKLG